jgi:K+-sensing histidine kinase KdpD
MLHGQPERIGFGIGCAAVTAAMVAVLYRYTGAPLPFLFLLPIFAASWQGNRAGGHAALLPSIICAYYFTEPVGWRMTKSGAVSVIVFALASYAIIEVITRMQEAIGAREALLSVVSHDLKTPLSTMLVREHLLVTKSKAGTLSSEELQAHAGRR